MKVLVVGAGIAGLAAARALMLQGIECEVVERRQAPPVEGAGIFLLGNATRALEELGVLSAVMQVAQPIERQRIMSAGGKLLNNVRTADVWKDCGPCVALHRRSLVGILEASLERVTVRYGNEAISTAINGDQRTVRFSDGREDGYDLVIGAAGVNSALRTAVFGISPVREVGIACWRLIVRSAGEIDSWTAMLGSGRTLLGIPLNRNETYIYADCSKQDYGDGSVARMQELFGAFASPLGKFVRNLDPSTNVHGAVLQEVPNQRWIADRHVLIGDSAHACSPSMAQGAAMAIEDAVMLGRLLSRQGPLDSILQHFHDARASRVGWVQKKSKERDRMRSGSTIVRNAALLLLGNSIYRRAYETLADPTH